MSLSAEAILIVPFRDEFAAAFERLNRDWLEGFDLLEDNDLPYLLDPRGTIIAGGGIVLCALQQGEVIGTVAVIRQSDTVFELAKLAVAPRARGRGLGRRLTQAAIDFAAASGGEVLALSTSSKLEEAIELYKSLGFTASSAPSGVVYATADVFMALRLHGAARR